MRALMTAARSTAKRLNEAARPAKSQPTPTGDMAASAGFALAVTSSTNVATRAGARLMGLKDYGLAAGCDGSLVLVPGENLAEIVVSRPKRTLTVKRGRVVARDNVAPAAP